MEFVFNFNYKTHQIIDIVDSEKEFELFTQNFKKNNNTFPYIKNDKVHYIVIQTKGKKSKVCGILAYGMPSDILKYREAHDDERHDEYAHIFDVEVLEQYRGLGLGMKLIEKAIEKIKQDTYCKGLTLMAKNKNLSDTYNKKFGFKVYYGEDKNDSPMMFKDF